MREKDPLAPGRWVTLEGLQTADLNGCIGEIIESQNSQGRVGVRTRQGNKLIKLSNLQTFADDAVIKVARIGARGEEVAPKGPGGVRTWFWPSQVLDELPSETSPISELIGIPLNVARIEPHKKLEGDESFDNYYATNFMVAPSTGLAPAPWQALVGPVVIWRPGGEPFSADDACLVRGFIDHLLKQYPDIDVKEAITPSAFQEFKRRTLEEEKETPLAAKSEDVNI